MGTESSAADGGLEAGSRVAGYVLQEQIGRGGMAVVFRALDERLNRPVALKVLAPGLAEDTSFRQRFVRESRAAAAVDDPHIIPVFEAGEASGVLFIAMRFVGGGDVGTLLRREGPLSPSRAAAIISPVASALDAAHEAGLVHRDVKPANMLLDARPGRPEHVYVSDFGLSKGVLAVGGLTGTGLFLGTLDYVAPEQIKGEPVDGRADQYSLASAAFELLTGAPPFNDHGPTSVMYAHLEQPPPALTSRRPDLPAAANAVFARALAKAAADRYPTCRDFSEELRGALGLAPYADAHPTSAPVREPAAEQAGGRTETPDWRGPDWPGPDWPGPGRGPDWPGPGQGPDWPGPRPTREERSPDSQPRGRRAHGSRRPPRAHSSRRGPRAGSSPRPRRRSGIWIWTGSALAVAALAAAGAATLLPGRHGTHGPPAGNASSCTTPPPSRGADWAAGVRGRPLVSLGSARRNIVEGMAFSPDGKIVAVGTRGATYLVGVASGQIRRRLRDQGGRGVESVAFSCDGAMVAVADANGRAYLWTTDGAPAGMLTGTAGTELRAVAFSPDGRLVAAGDSAGQTYLWRTRSLSKPTETLPGTAAAQALAFAPDSKVLAVGDAAGATHLWRVGSTALAARPSGAPAAARPFATLTDPAAVQAVAFSRDAKTLATGDASGSTSLWDLLRRSARRLPAQGSAGPYGTVALAFSGSTLAAGGYTGQTYLWNATTRTLINTVTDPVSGALNVQAVAFSPDGRFLATGDTSGDAYLWTATG